MSFMIGKHREMTLTFVVQAYDKGTRQWTCEVKEDVRSSVLWNVTLLYDTFLLQLLVCKFVRTKSDGLLRVSRCPTGGLIANIVQVTLVSLELALDGLALALSHLVK